MKLSIDFVIDLHQCTDEQKYKIEDFITELRNESYPCHLNYEFDITPEGEIICDKNNHWQYRFVRIESIENTDEFEKVLQWLTNKRIPYVKRPRKVYYEEGESRLEDYYQFEFEPVLRLKDWQEYGTIFRYNECDNCQLGIEQIGRITIPVKKISKYDLIMIRPVMLLKRAVKEELEAIQATGIKFLPIIDYTTKKESEDYFQLKVLHYLPPKKDFVQMVTPYCPVCHRLSVRLFRRAQYSKNDLNGRYDFYLGFERDLSSLATKYVFPKRLLIISRRILEIFERHCDMNDEWFEENPIHLWDDDKFNENGYLK